MPICNSTSSCPGRRLVVHMFEDVAATIHARAVICHYQPFLDCQRSTARGREAAIGRQLPSGSAGTTATNNAGKKPPFIAKDHTNFTNNPAVAGADLYATSPATGPGRSSRT